MSVTVETAIRGAQSALRAAKVEAPRREARLLVALALGQAPTLATDVCIPEGVQAAIDRLVARRADREPYAHLAGVKEFMGHDFSVSAAALIPRPETESLVEALLEGTPARRILDLGTGTGAILLSLLSRWPEAHGVGVDCSLPALELAMRNAESLTLNSRAAFVASNWCSALGGATVFDLVVCNPPYVRSGDLRALEPEVREFEPFLALDGGPDGLAPVRSLLPDLIRVLAPDARVAFETDPPLWGDLAALVEQAGGRSLTCIRDLAGRSRGMLALFPDASGQVRFRSSQNPHLDV